MDELIERVAKAMFEAPDPDDPEASVCPWPPKHPDDLAWWISRARAAINTLETFDEAGPRPGVVLLPRPRPANYIEREEP